MISDGTMVLVGAACGQLPGVNTILIACCIGPAIQWFEPFNRRILEGSFGEYHFRDQKNYY